MNNNLITKLAKRLLYPNKPSESLLGTLKRHAVPLQMPTLVDVLVIDQLLKEHSLEAWMLYKNMERNSTCDKLIYVFLCISNQKLSIEEDLRRNIKKAALGFEVSFFNPIKIFQLKDQINYALYNLVSQVYSKSLVYKKLKLELQKPSSVTHKNFLTRLIPFLRAYEATVLASDEDLLSFYCGMYLIYQEINKISRIDEVIKEKRLFCEYFSGNDDFKMGGISNIYKNIPAMLIHKDNIDEDIMDYKETVFQTYNDFTREYLLNGIVKDAYKEYFIRDGVLDYGLIPPFISKATAESIEYIGKYTHFMKQTGLLNLDPSIQVLIGKLDLSKNRSLSSLKIILNNINRMIYEHFIKKYQIIELLKYLNDTFLFGRGDFIENLFVSLKESRKFSRKNIISILEQSLQSSFPGNPFNCLMDIYIGMEDIGSSHGFVDQGGNCGDRGFSLYCKLNFPTSMLLEEDLMIKLSYIFRFLWKLKKIDHLSRRIGVTKYVNFIQRLMYYVLNEVIGELSAFEWDCDAFACDLLKKEINKKIDIIMKNLFINTKEKKMEYLIFYMENAFMKAGVGGEFDDSEIQSSLRDFRSISKSKLEGTYLYNIDEFISSP